MKLLLVILSLLLLGVMPTQLRVVPADIVFKNGNVYTANDSSPKAQAVAVKGDRVVSRVAAVFFKLHVSVEVPGCLYRSRNVERDLRVAADRAPATVDVCHNAVGGYIVRGHHDFCIATNPGAATPEI